MFGHSGGPLVRTHPAHDLSATPCLHWLGVLGTLPHQKAPGSPVRAVRFSGGQFLQVAGRPACSPPSQTCILGSRVRLILVCACHQPKLLVTTFSRPPHGERSAPEPDGKVTGVVPCASAGILTGCGDQCLLGHGDTRIDAKLFFASVNVRILFGSVWFTPWADRYGSGTRRRPRLRPQEAGGPRDRVLTKSGQSSALGRRRAGPKPQVKFLATRVYCPVWSPG
ncbi:uncharacterized protein LOC111154516 [Enhydra lutris kenyoni]|uniref:Uncharacterized protein LOC111154516 n=1 Tax=Enhydra lutris kenyoni TaxID=391180 RepID=A0A2Y9K8W8_ENHLU|nr:uncharacterized protein LOC111154516 [Enhydra lutris kenyoni]